MSHFRVVVWMRFVTFSSIRQYPQPYHEEDNVLRVGLAHPWLLRNDHLAVGELLTWAYSQSQMWFSYEDISLETFDIIALVKAYWIKAVRLGHQSEITFHIDFRIIGKTTERSSGISDPDSISSAESYEPS